MDNRLGFMQGMSEQHRAAAGAAAIEVGRFGGLLGLAAIAGPVALLGLVAYQHTAAQNAEAQTALINAKSKPPEKKRK